MPFSCFCAIVHAGPNPWNFLSLLVHLLNSYFALQNLIQMLFVSQDISLTSPDTISLFFQYFYPYILFITNTFALIT